MISSERTTSPTRSVPLFTAPQPVDLLHSQLVSQYQRIKEHADSCINALCYERSIENNNNNTKAPEHEHEQQPKHRSHSEAHHRMTLSFITVAHLIDVKNNVVSSSIKDDESGGDLGCDSCCVVEDLFEDKNRVNNGTYDVSHESPTKAPRRTTVRSSNTTPEQVPHMQTPPVPISDDETLAPMINEIIPYLKKNHFNTRGKGSPQQKQGLSTNRLNSNNKRRFDDNDDSSTRGAQPKQEHQQQELHPHLLKHIKLDDDDDAPPLMQCSQFFCRQVFYYPQQGTNFPSIPL